MLRIFVSYARDDNQKPDDRPKGSGFITHLCTKLRLDFKDIGPDRPKLWRDEENVPDAEPFDPLLESGLAGSQLMLVVLSPNWVSRPYCQNELKQFRSQFPQESAAQIDRRIILAVKRPVEPLPSGLPKSVGYKFFDTGEVEGSIQQYFMNGEPGPGWKQKEDYDRVSRNLAEYLMLRARDPSGAAHIPPTPPGPPPPNDPDEAPSRAPQTPGRRTVFVAKPSGDMVTSYRRLVQDLDDAGYDVTPRPEDEIPASGGDPAGMVRAALGRAEVAVHLLGASAGFTPEQSNESISRLQLRAAAEPRPNGRDVPRLIWAPKRLPEAVSEQPDRAPEAVFEHLSFGGDALREADKLLGDEQLRFVDFVLRYLERRPPVPPVANLDPGSTILIEYHESDWESAIILNDSLLELKLTPKFVGSSSDDKLRDARRSALVEEVDGVMLCWSEAEEIWARSQADLLVHDVRRRQRSFACRVVVQIAPDNDKKRFFRKTPPRQSIDRVIDATSGDRSDVDALTNTLRPHLCQPTS